MTKVDSLSLVTNTKNIDFTTKPVANSNIEVFANNSSKGNVDELTLSNRNSSISLEEKQDTNKKWLIAAGITLASAAVGVAGYFLFKSAATKKATELLKKSTDLGDDIVHNSTTLKEFKPVTTLEEAKQIAKNEYGIKTLEIKNVDTANDLLYTLQKIKSKTKGPIEITKIIEEPVLLNNPMIGGYMIAETGELHLSSAGLRRSFCFRLGEMAQQVSEDKLDEYIELLQNINKKDLPLFKLTQEFENLGLKCSNVQALPFGALVHEQGHRAHRLAFSKSKDYWKLGKLEEIKAMRIKDFSIFEEFMSDKIQNTIKSCPFLGKYALTSPCEFVAETYTALIHGVDLPKEILDLYRKYNGPLVG